jgi:hypothetical protein
VASGPKVSVALSDRPVALLVVFVVGWHALVSHVLDLCDDLPLRRHTPDTALRYVLEA